MATFDVDGYRKAAKSAGISDAEIENEIKFQTGSPAKTDPFEKNEGGFQLGSLDQIQERLGNDWWHFPAGLAAIGAGIYGASKLMGGGSDDPNTPNGRPTYRFDPTFDVEPLAPQAPQAPQAPAPVPAPDRLQQAQQIAEANRQLGIGAQTLSPVPPTAPVAAPVAAPEPISTPISAAPIEAPAPTPSAQPNSFATETIVNEVKDMIQKTPDPVTGAVAQPPQPVAPPQELRTGTGKPAFAGMGPAAALNKKGEPKFKPDYADINQVPKDYAFVPNAQYIDTPRQNIGLPEYIKAYTDRPFPLTNEQAIQESKEINKLLGRATRAEAKAAGLPPAEITPGITKKTSAGTKPVRVAGTLGALIAIPDLAKANTPGQQAMAGANLLEAVLPPGFMMGSAGEGSTLSPQIVAQQKAYMDNLNRLGSPFAQTEAAQQFRRNEEMTRRIAGRTGAAVPPQYRR
jgi:hypothetical protein